MSETKKTYWKGLAQLNNDPNYVKHADKEFVDLGVEENPGHSRRDFLRMMGFSVAAASSGSPCVSDPDFPLRQGQQILCRHALRSSGRCSVGLTLSSMSFLFRSYLRSNG